MVDSVRIAILIVAFLTDNIAIVEHAFPLELAILVVLEILAMDLASRIQRVRVLHLAVRIELAVRTAWTLLESDAVLGLASMHAEELLWSHGKAMRLHSIDLLVLVLAFRGVRAL